MWNDLNPAAAARSLSRQDDTRAEVSPAALPPSSASGSPLAASPPVVQREGQSGETGSRRVSRARATTATSPKKQDSQGDFPSTKRQRNLKRSEATSMSAQGGVRELVQQCTGLWAKSPQHATTELYEQLRPESVFELFNDERNRCLSPRPDVVSISDAGQLFMERTEGPPRSSRMGRRPSGLQLWNQADMLWTKRVEPYRFGTGRTGEVWAKAIYGQVQSSRQTPAQTSPVTPKAPSAVAEDAQKLRFIMYELHWFNKGRKATEAVPAIDVDGGRQSSKRSRKKMAERGGGDWVQRGLFQLRRPKHEQSAAASAAASATEGNTVRGTLTLQLDEERGNDKWIQFDDQDGNDKGAIQLSKQGRLELESTAGDFAEYYPVDPSEAQSGGPFEEGDLVGFGSSGLTRRTKGVKQLGVITRRAIIKGSRPAHADASLYDTVAHVGIVPVKVRPIGPGRHRSLSGFQNGSFVTPSGLEDGTGIIVRGCPTQRVGRTVAAVTSVHDVDSSVAALADDAASCTMLDVCCCSKSPSVDPFETRWQLVKISVIDPTLTIIENNRMLRNSFAFLLCLLSLLVVSLLVLPCTYFRCHCEPLALAHGTTSGACEGDVGNTCKYESCDDGYIMLPLSDANDASSYDMAPSTELRQMVAKYGACKRPNNYLVEKNISLIEALELEGWICYRHDGSQNDTNYAANTHHGYSDAGYTWDWCTNHTSYCTIKPPVCTVCNYPAINSGWRNCEMSTTVDGLERVCMRPDDWVYTPSRQADDCHASCFGQHTIRITTACYMPGLGCVESISLPVLDACTLPSLRGSTSDRWIGQRAWNGTARRFHAGQICMLPLDADATRNGISVDDHRRSMQQFSGPLMRDTPAESETGKLGEGVFLERQCRAQSVLAGSAYYSGTPMRCVERLCPAETLSLRSIQACHRCEAKDAIVHFPRTSASSAGRTSSVTLDCPVGFSGSVTRTCQPDGQWSKTEGACTRLYCRPLQIPTGDVVPARVGEICKNIPLPETQGLLDDGLGDTYDFGDIDGIQELANLCLGFLSDSTVFEAAPEGTGTMVAQCPWPSNAGYMSAVCLPGATEWSNIQGHCTLQTCPTTRRNVTQGGVTHEVQLPQQVRGYYTPSPRILLAPKLGHWNFDTLIGQQQQSTFSASSAAARWDVIPCCSEWTNFGSCIGDTAALGWLLSQCVSSTVHKHENNTSISSQTANAHHVYKFSEADRLSSSAGAAGRDVNLGCKNLASLVGGVRLDQDPGSFDNQQRVGGANTMYSKRANRKDSHHGVEKLSPHKRTQTAATIAPASKLADSRWASSQVVGRKLYRALTSNFDHQIRDSTKDQWALPGSGILSSISVAIRQHPGQPARIEATPTAPVDNHSEYVQNPWEWRPVFISAPTNTQGKQHAALDATLTAATRVAPPADNYERMLYASRRSMGRPAAAFADAACVEMGYSRAVLVTTCNALLKAVVGGHISSIPEEDLVWWSSRSVDTAFNGSKPGRATLDDIEGAQGVPFLAEICPEIVERAPTSAPAPSNSGTDDDTVHSSPFGSISASARHLQCSSWLGVGTDSLNHVAHKEDWKKWLAQLAWNQENPGNYSMGTQFGIKINEDAAAAIADTVAATGKGTTMQEWIDIFHSIDKLVDDREMRTNPFPPDSSCSGHPKEAEDVTRCFFSQLQRLLDFPSDNEQRHNCIDKIVVGCSNESPAATQLQHDNHDEETEQRGTVGHQGVWVIGDQTNGAGVVGNWLAPKIFTDFSGPYDCATGDIDQSRAPNACYGKLLEYW